MIREVDMKIPKFLGAIVALSLVGVLAAGCAKKTTTPITTTTDVTVGTGNITVSITSTGSMDYSDYENLSFAADGTVGAVNVKTGDIVKKDQVLATLDPDAWNTSIQALTQAIQTAQRNLTNSQASLAAAQRAVTTAQLNVTQGQLGLTSDQNKLASDQNALTNLAVVQTAQAAVDAAQANITAAQANLNAATAQGDSAAANYLSQYIVTLKQTLTDAQNNLKSVLNTTSTTLTTTAVQQIINAKAQLDTDNLKILMDQNSLLGLQAAIDTANTTVANAQIDLTNAKTAVTTAQTNLDTTKAASTQIIAPFDGAITTVSIAAGTGMSGSTTGSVKKGATAIVIADTSKFKASLMVNETDIGSISIGTLATITASALPGTTINARVTAISPVATVQSGVVNYAVTATVLGIAASTRTAPTGSSSQSGTTTTTPAGSGTATDTTPVTTGRSRIVTPTGAPGQSGVPPTGLPFGGGQGGNFADLTPEQIAALAQRAQQGGFGGFGGQSGAASPSGPAQLRQGLSLTINLIEQQKLNVITVPNTAVKTTGGKSYVQVKTSTGSEQREVTIGLKDYTNSEVVSGLTAGDIVLITKTTSAAKTTTTQAPGGFGIGGGILR
jgi:multidrug efflux pump subunit AcrA (membrane-fusion protein)